ncbi:cysteine-rich receptor-like protein kinase 8 isoform X2 [Helianthus annuus]|uniref:cysteine-rich receptor-like protein kinase 8 isoform X2 n=1 Tax=Helianthus annuus TaxID=4232 RepID=UPI0016532194|nr:cysteine-rich receptor-like protein kinase 8 isoform X2 [Helianthus annuus]
MNAMNKIITIIPKPLLFFCFNLLTLISQSQSRFLDTRCEGSNYTANSTYETNLNLAVSSLAAATAATNGFFNRSVGQAPDEVNTLVLCRGDVEPDTCRQCVNDSFGRAKLYCPYRKVATVWFDDCMLRFSNEKILGTVDANNIMIWVTNNIQNADELYKAMRPLMDRLKTEAAGGDSRRKFATGDTPGPGFMRIYGLMQCTPELSEDECYSCLETATNRIPDLLSLDVRILSPSCVVRYLNVRFFNATVALSPPPMEALSPPPILSPPPPNKNSMTVVIIVVTATVSVVILALVFFCVFTRRKRRLESRSSGMNSVREKGDTEEITTAKSLQYSFGVIKAATNNFSENNKLGDGGFGVVYKGKLENGKEIAVKRLSRESGQGEQEFKNEVLLLAKLQHRNLVRLLGFSLEGSERLLMYEFVQNASLDKFIFHFGTARLFTPEESQANTFRIVGTYGYMAPEYALHGLFSVKSDVYSFGVLILEIVTGRNNHSFQNGVVIEDLLSHAWKCWRDGTASSLIDSTLKDGTNSIRDMIRCIHIGLLCVQEEASDRPTMASVVLMLASSSITLAVPSEPAFFMHTDPNPNRQRRIPEHYSSTMSNSNNL